jgi:hypothetical protein
MLGSTSETIKKTQVGEGHSLGVLLGPEELEEMTGKIDQIAEILGLQP